MKSRLYSPAQIEFYLQQAHDNYIVCPKSVYYKYDLLKWIAEYYHLQGKNRMAVIFHIGACDAKRELRRRFFANRSKMSSRFIPTLTDIHEVNSNGEVPS